MFNFFHKKTSSRLFWSVDLHSHVCPGIDDGSPDIQTSIDLVGGMSRLGFKKMVVTPHVTEETFPNTPEIISRSFQSLKEGLRLAGMDMEMGVSAEYRADDMFRNRLSAAEVVPLPGEKYILVENAWLAEPYGLDALMFEIASVYGWIPILAHPERYVYYHSDYSRYRRLYDAGVRLQVNLLSLAGYYGKSIKKIADSLVGEGLVSFVGSDLHNERHLNAIEEYLASNEVKKLEKQAGLLMNDKAFG